MKMYDRDIDTLVDILNTNIDTNNYIPFNEKESVKIRQYHKDEFDSVYQLPYDDYEGDNIRCTNWC